MIEEIEMIISDMEEEGIDFKTECGLAPIEIESRPNLDVMLVVVDKDATNEKECLH